MVMLMTHDDPSINPESAVPACSLDARPNVRIRMSRTPSAAKTFLAKARDVILPPQCPGCRDIVEAPDTLCGPCWSRLRLIGPAVCDACGLPFSYEQDVPLCASCAGRMPPFQRARSAVVYDDASRDLVLAFKHADRTEAAMLFAHWMITAAPQLLADADLIVPVPLDRRRLFDRRYNQAALLAQGLARLTGIACLLDGVKRIKPSPPLWKNNGSKRMSRTERRRNVAGAFRVCETAKPDLRGKRVLVVDDVYTTGATAWAMARCLKRGGVQAVDVLTVARVVHN